MALTIGELVGFIRFDPSGVDDGAGDAESRMRQLGNQMGGDADRAGHAAGLNLGNGLVLGADGAIRDGEGQIVGALRQVGDDAGDGLADGASQGAEGASGKISDILGNIKGFIIGGTIGAALMNGLGEAMDQQKITGRLQAQLGTTPALAQKYGKIAGQLYSSGIAEDFQSAVDAIGATMSAGILPPDASNAQIKSISTNVADLANTFDQDLGGVTNAVSQMLRTGLAKNGKEALDILTVGFQSSANKADDLLDTFNEYGTQFRKAGIDGATAVGLMNQAIQAGARDSDIAADAIKEFSIRAVDGSKTTESGFKALGLNADDMAKKFSKGGSSASAALDTTLDRLRNVKDPIKQAQVATSLFGTQAEDLGKALFAMDPSSAAKGIGKVGGAADKMGKALHDNASTKVEAFKRQLQQGLVNVLAQYVIPILTNLPGILSGVGSAFASVAGFISRNKEIFITIGAVITTILLPSLVSMAVTAATSAATTVAAWVAQSVSALATAATYVGVNAIIIAGWVRQGAAAVLAGARVVATWVLMGVQSMIQAARMAAAWVIAMGPVGWVIAAIVGLVALIIANWDTVKKWTAAAWDWVWTKIKQVAQFLLDLFMNWTIVGQIIQHWDAIKAGTQAAWNWVKNAVMTVVNWLLQFATAQFNAIRTVVTVVWNAIKTASSAVWNAIKAVINTVWGWIKTFITVQVNAVKTVVTGVWNAIKSVSSTVWNGIKSVISTAVNNAKAAVSSAVSGIKGFFSSGFNAVKTTVSNAISNVVANIKGLGGRVKSAISGAATWLVNAGKSIITGLINGIKSMAGKVGDAVKSVLKGARDLLPFSPAKKGPFSGKGWTLYSGRAISEALARGILERKQRISDAMKLAVMQAKRHQVAVASASTAFQTGQTARYTNTGQEMAGVQNGYGGKTINIEKYYESNSGSAYDTALELAWLAKARG